MQDMQERDKRDREIMEEIRRRTKDGRFLDCSCKKTDCVRHGICSECTAVHRNNRTTLPACVRDMAARISTTA